MANPHKPSRRWEVAKHTPGSEDGTSDGANGAEGAAGTDAPRPLEVAQEAAHELASRNRRQALPLAGIAATYILGLIAAALPGLWALLPVAAGAGLALGAYAAAHQNRSRPGRIYAGTASAAATGWLGLSLVTGPFGAMTWLLWLGGYAMAVPYWAAHTDPET